MRIVTANEWQQWLTQGSVLEKDVRGPKVLRLSDGLLLKVFRPRRKLWMARLRPQAERFASNAQLLKARKVRVPEVTECFWVDRGHAVSACLYAPLPGLSMEQIFRQSRGDFNHLLPRFAAYIRSLHQRGIYFRSLHLGNVLHLPDGDFGLIDFLDLRLRRRPLPPRLVRRNLEHLRSYLARSKVDDFPWEALLAEYAHPQKHEYIQSSHQPLDM